MPSDFKRVMFLLSQTLLQQRRLPLSPSAHTDSLGFNLRNSISLRMREAIVSIVETISGLPAVSEQVT